jgi:RNA polymerase sigma-54 factor
MAGEGMQTRLIPGQNLALQQVLSPQLQQSLLVLQTPLLELRNLVQQEMETNPVLEELPDEPSADQPAEPSVDDNFKNEFEKLASLDEEWRDYMAQSVASGAEGFRSSREAKDKRQFFFDSIAVQETLQQNLLGQLNQTALNAGDRKAAELIVGNIDDNGFLQSTPEEMALNSGIPREDFEKMLALIQGFHPPGVGALDLRECLLIQLKREGKENSLEYKIVSGHMEDLGRRRFPEIARRMGISAEDVQKAADNIGRLNPRPGQVFAAAPQTMCCRM